MKIDWEYIKGLLEAFEESDQRTLTLFDLKKVGFDFEEDQDNFIFHMQLLCDEDLIDRESGHKEMGPKIFGLLKTSMGYTVSVIPLRLTMSGHEFAANLRDKEIWAKIKTNISNQSFSAIVTLAKDLSVGYAKKKVEAILKGND